MEGKLGNQAPVIEEFEPYSKWQRKDDHDILEIHVQDFKKEQLKVQISNQGTLKISGERGIDSSRRSKFYKELTISHIYDASAVTAKFANGWLHIALPKRKNLVSEKEDQRGSGSKIAQKPKQESSKGEPPQESSSSDTEDANADELRGRQWASALKLAKKTATVVAMGVAAAALVAYVIYIYKSTIVED